MSTTTPLVERDERTVAVANAGYRLAYMLLSFALLIDVMYRGLMRDEAAWDLLALVILGGAVCAVYQARQKTLPSWATKGMIMACVGGAIGAIIGVSMAWFRG